MTDRQANELEWLIHAAIDALARQQKLYEAETALMAREDRPEVPRAKAAELKKTCSLQREDIYARREIERFFDRKIKHFEREDCPAWPRLKFLERAISERARVLTLFDERDRAFRDWSAANGANEIDRQIDAVADELAELTRKVIDYRCRTIEEVAMKAKFMLSVFDEQDNAEPFIKAMRNMVEHVVV